MPKIDKALYTKDQYKVLKAALKAKKAASKLTQSISITEHLQSKIPTAFVLGNGTSRVGISPIELQKLGKVYGCNALYRSFTPDHLIAVDTKMVVEINKANYQKTNQVWTNPNKLYSTMEGFNFFQPSKGWSSGPTALWLASQHQNTTIYILGFDYKGINGHKVFNNVYANTENYKKTSDTATYYGNWLRQTKTVIESNSSIKYIRVIASDNYIPDELNKISNLKHITIEVFKKKYFLT
jgi:hypothetical protein|tara:strand:+ start:1101 stop:1817 length:717 start_codon:yes stop_codon:yes gene_type:complete